MTASDETLDWQRIEEAFHRLAPLPATAWADAVRLECGGNEAMAGELLALLEGSASQDRVDGAIQDVMEDWLEHGPTEGRSEPQPVGDGEIRGGRDWRDPVTPTQLGPFRVLRRLSEGGQAVVYLAERETPYRQQVAIKLLKRGMDTDEILRRLRLEGQILAQLEHPNIARLLDGGSTDDGRPFFALEYIDGLPIDSYCDRSRLDLKARLRLFCQACGAVQVAHARLVIHRDLKASNLLVTVDGEPKLLDFGIAKLLDASELDMTAARTRTGYRWLTPAYAAPEQIRGLPLTTAVDIYALGVLLYLLLTGELPRKTAGAGVEELESLTGAMPEAPSRRLRRSADAEVAACRATSVERLQRQVRGDLDTIVLKAMHPEPDRRYGSVQQLAEDVERYLRSEPISARGDTWLYLSSKFVRRNFWGVVTVATVFVALTAAVAGTTRAMRVAESQRALAERRLEEVHTVMDFTTGMFKIADPGEAAGSEVTVRQILDRSAPRIDEEMKDRPALAARLMDTVGLVYRNLGLYEQAEEQLRRSAERWPAVVGFEGDEALESRRLWAAVLIDQGRYQEARDLLEGIRRVELADPQRFADDPRVGTTLHQLAQVAEYLEDADTAEALHREALAVRLDRLGPQALEVAESRNDLGELLFKKRLLEPAEAQYRQALDIRLAALGPLHPDVAELRNNLAALLSGKGDHGAAEQEFRNVVAIRREVLGSDHRDVVVSLNNLSITLCKQGRHDESEARLNESLAIGRRVLPRDHVVMLQLLNNLAMELKHLGRFDEALDRILETIESADRLFGRPNPQSAMLEFSRAQILVASGDTAAAEQVLHGDIAQMDRLSMAEDIVASPLTLLAELLASSGRCDAALPLIRRAMASRRELPEQDGRRLRTESVARLCPTDETS